MKYEVYFNVSGKFGCVVDNTNIGPDNPEGDLDHEGAEEIVKDANFGPLENMKYTLDNKRFFANGGSEFEYAIHGTYKVKVDEASSPEDARIQANEIAMKTDFKDLEDVDIAYDAAMVNMADIADMDDPEGDIEEVEERE